MKVERDIEIEVPPEKVYGVLMDPNCLKRWVTIHQGLEDQPAGDLRKGSELHQKLKVAGQKFSVRWKVTETKKPERVVWEGQGPMKTKANIRYSLEKTEDGNTRFSYFNEYELPGGALGKMAGRAVSGQAAKETEKSLLKLKAFLERDG